ncbi:restriction endonuclease subunit S [Bacillus haynesii]|uniref:restriction endonuclease subunit S n=1 Tax=Bacillus haynesii TaxID=1925021 RepID=UPI0015933C01|nr:restriction endonuclease subunit S [Bacillus haynesii]NVB32095.1 restriction endonuclease [Bacillus licheniformis]MCY7781070.1 restriction endonuclease subunit S [Bacillus haynesii]MEC0668892.1 restriction endonuclease subunit S [Bacillus haynesii]MEC1417363.1 restriction endonuclease subunit S [Bacillus haynesii]MEC1467434.1 restriction endonuclease subunit S [Bacillus haynesii]
MNDKLQIELNSREWRAFPIGELFEVDKGVYLPEKDITEGETPYITANSSNNGVSRFIGNKPLFDGNTITIEKINFKAYYQAKPFYCSHDVTVLRHKKLNKYNGIFIANMITRQGEKYSYGKQAQLNVTKRESVLLPVNSKNDPDWDFMEYFIKELEFKIKPNVTYKEHIIKDWRELGEVKWGEFNLEDLFDTKIGKSINGNKVNKVDGITPYITRKESYNGLDGFIDWKDTSFLNRVNTPVITIGNETAKPFVQEYSFFTGTKVNILTPKFGEANKYHLLFICRSLEMNKRKYSYSYTINSTRLKKQKIKLPVTIKGDPDWSFMEQYMKRLENDLNS